MKTYIAVIDNDEDSAFGVWFPDVPGCFSAADEPGDIVRNAIEALTLHLDDIDHPQARDVAAIAADPEVRAAVLQGAYLLGIPFVTTAHKIVRANISIDKGTLAAIDSAAKERGLTRSAFIAEAAQNEVMGR